LTANSINNCRICGKVFLHITGPLLCETCREELERIYFLARDEVRKSSPGETIDSFNLSDRLNVDPIYIQIIIEEGLLEQEGYSFGNPDSRRSLAREFESELKDMSRRKDTSRNSGGMFLNERHSKGKD